MRKFFMVAAIGVLALLVASPASALDFKFGAEYRVRFYDYINNGFTELPGSNPRGVQLRVRPRFDVSDDNGNMTATLRLEIGDVEWGNGGGAHGVTNGTNVAGSSSARVGNGAGGGIGNDGVNVETKWAYVDFASPFGIPLRWRAGIQPWFLSKGLIMDDDAAGVRAYGKAGIVSYEVAWFRATAGLVSNGGTTATVTGQTFVTCTVNGVRSTAATAAACTLQGGVASGTGSVVNNVAGNAAATSNTLDDNLDFYQAKVDLAIAPWLNPGIYYIYGDNRATNTTVVGGAAATEPVQQHFLGASLTGDLKFLKYDLDFVYGIQEGGNSGNFTSGTTRQDVKGWVVDGGVHIPIGPVLIHAVGSYATGDDQDGGDSETMPYISPSWNGAGGLYEIFGSGGTFDVFDTQDYPGGTWMVGGGAEYRPIKALWLRAMYGFIGFSKGSANCAGTTAACYGPSYPALVGKSTIGHEISLRADYDLWTNFKIQAAAGWLFPSEGDTNHEYILQLLYNF